METGGKRKKKRPCVCSHLLFFHGTRIDLFASSVVAANATFDV
jgi:hypothetical protein